MEAYQPPPVPYEASPGLRQYLDEQMARLAGLVNDAAYSADIADFITGAEATAAIASAIAPLAVLADDENVTGDWRFTGDYTNFENIDVYIKGKAGDGSPRRLFIGPTQSEGNNSDGRFILIGENNATLYGSMFHQISGALNISGTTEGAATVAATVAQFNMGLYVAAGNNLHVRDGGSLLVREASDVACLDMRHDGDFGIIGDDGGNGIQLLPTSAGARSGIISAQLSAADDATVSFNIPYGGGFVFIVGSTTSNTTNVDSLFAWWQVDSILTEIWAAGSGFWSLGTGSNPDIDGDTNIWFTNSGTTLNIKNRRGAFRYYNVFLIGGD